MWFVPGSLLRDARHSAGNKKQRCSDLFPGVSCLSSLTPLSEIPETSMIRTSIARKISNANCYPPKDDMGISKLSPYALEPQDVPCIELILLHYSSSTIELAKRPKRGTSHLSNVSAVQIARSVSRSHVPTFNNTIYDHKRKRGKVAVAIDTRESKIVIHTVLVSPHRQPGH